MKITLKDGSVKEYETICLSLISQKISVKDWQELPVQARLTEKLLTLELFIDKDCELNILTFDDEGKHAIPSHSIPYICTGSKTLYPETKLAIGPSIDTGFYYDIAHEPIYTGRSCSNRKRNEEDRQKTCDYKIYKTKRRSDRIL